MPSVGIVGIHGLGRLPQGGYFMVMDLVDGMDLRARRNAGEVPPAQAAKWVADMAEIVARVHSAGYTHGDLKPANVLVEYSGRVLLTDFGFARSIGPDTGRPPVWIAGGTPAFLAPELVHPSDKPPGPAIDVFGLGGILFWLLTGRAVHEETTTASMLASLSDPTWEAHVDERLPARVPIDLGDLCRSCLASDPPNRPELGELIWQLRRRA